MSGLPITKLTTISYRAGWVTRMRDQCDERVSESGKQILSLSFANCAAMTSPLLLRKWRDAAEEQKADCGFGFRSAILPASVP